MTGTIHPNSDMGGTVVSFKFHNGCVEFITALPSAQVLELLARAAKNRSSTLWALSILTETAPTRPVATRGDNVLPHIVANLTTYDVQASYDGWDSCIKYNFRTTYTYKPVNSVQRGGTGSTQTKKAGVS